MGADDLARNKQAEASSLAAFGGIKFAENQGFLFFAHAGPVVGDADFNLIRKVLHGEGNLEWPAFEPVPPNGQRAGGRA